ncbi:restriction endonuclease subunit S [Lactococcus lactis]|uniref:Restriction endonuclease subunit S n=1 Tax=Lactococcus lactis TaxID=1358 RepID=A0A552YXF7_9LACT|nr:restriction endonuclease subunit S [Lactococcus lactis]TRW71928.1 restriction endonuclease subunit S [Lactococcus lactis]
MKERLKAPELRFPGFTDDWEERKLGELSNIVGGGTPSTSNPEYWDGDIDWYAPAEIGEQSYVSKSKKTITELGLKKSSARILPVGTVLFTSRAGIGNTAILAKEATTNQGFQSIVPGQNKLDSYFIFSRTNELKRYGEVTGAGSTFVEVSGKQMSKMSIMVPELSEQQKIGSFFKQLDDTIALHQRKLDLLKEQKTGYLQKMFPKNGAKVPELRFAGFADDWEERKLESFTLLITKQTGFDYSATIKPALVNKSEGNVYPFIQNKNFSGFKINMNTDFYIPIEVANKFPRITLDQPSLLVTISGNIGNVGLYNSDEKAFVGGAVGICKLNNLIEGEFILYELESDFGQRQFKRSTKSSSHANITVEMIKNIDILIPKNELEQKKIGSFFKQLDDTIALHQRKLDLLKEQKKGFLQKMFV